MMQLAGYLTIYTTHQLALVRATHLLLGNSVN